MASPTALHNVPTQPTRRIAIVNAGARAAATALIALVAACTPLHLAPVDNPRLDGQIFEAPFTVAVTFVPPELGGYAHVAVHLRSERDLPDPLRFALPDRWGGRPGFDQDLDHFEAFDAQGAPLDLERTEATVRVDTAGADAVTLNYRVRPRNRLATEASRFRALVSRDRAFLPGHALLVQPVGVDPALVASVDLRLPEPAGPWDVRSSINDPAHIVPLRALLDAIFWAGPWNCAVVEIDPLGTVEACIDPLSPLEPETLAILAGRVVVAEQHLLGLTLARATSVIVLDRADDPQAVTGNGRHGGFVLELGRDVSLRDPVLAELVAHENLHRLLGHALRFQPDEEIATLWFREGFTDYLSLQALVRAGIVAPTRFFLRIGTALTLFGANPMADRAGVGVEAAEYWQNRDLRRLPYDKGVLLAALVDLALRDDDLDLAGFLAFLRDDSSARTLPLTNSALRDALGRYSGRDWTAFWTDNVLGAEELPVHTALAEAGLEVVERLLPAPFYGFRPGLTAEGEWFIAEVQAGSPAAQAGLVTGQALTNEPWVPTELGAGSARVVVGGSGVERTIVVTPTRGQRRTSVLESADGTTRYLDAFGLGATDE